MRQRARLQELAFGGGTREVVGGGGAGRDGGLGGVGGVKLKCHPCVCAFLPLSHIAPINTQYCAFYKGEFAESRRFLFLMRLLEELRQNWQRRFKSVSFLSPCVQLVPLRFQVYKRQAPLVSVFSRPQKSGSKQSFLLRAQKQHRKWLLRALLETKEKQGVALRVVAKEISIVWMFSVCPGGFLR